MTREAARLSDFVWFVNWGKRDLRDMRYGRTGRVVAPVCQLIERSKFST